MAYSFNYIYNCFDKPTRKKEHIMTTVEIVLGTNKLLIDHIILMNIFIISISIFHNTYYQGISFIIVIQRLFET